ncbi:peptidase M15 [Neptunicella marina]|uniref:Peptidase M15 n=1 Tax=Neptunicella marina TaxID=2125989 RepID=A0A8J6M595_9ALTE|nr:peptidase M15 [Neptunicella marina]MBC3766386.1 peptidase M15 [Neptunicella marina]
MSKSKITTLDNLARRRLSKHFFLRDFLFSETAAVHGINNIPDDIELAVEAGTQLCEKVLEPIQDAWGRLHIRSAFRSCEVNQLGNELGANCASNEKNYAGHIWDRRDEHGNMGATACIVIPAYLDYFEKTGDWTSLAWWIHAHIPACKHMYFFPNLCAFNISWYEDETAPKSISSYITDPNTGHKKRILTAGEVSDFYKKIPLEQRYAACEDIFEQLRN